MKALLVILAIIVVGALAFSRQSPAPGVTAQADANLCTPDKFKIEGLHGDEQLGSIAKITGMLYNGCDEAAGVQVRATIFDKNATVVNTEELWPESISNIPAHSGIPFKVTLDADRDWTKFSVTPIDVKHW